MIRIALILITLIGGGLLEIPAVARLIVCFWIGSQDWMDQVGLPKEK